MHFYNLNDQGLVGAGGTDKAGIFNIVLQPNEPDQVAAEAGCTSHVFWQAPDQNRMTIAWYGRGTRIVDFSDPANPKQLGFFIPTGGDTWSAKPHRGFIFTGDILRGMDVLLYTGEGGNAWPTTSGSAELTARGDPEQRSRHRQADRERPPARDLTPRPAGTAAERSGGHPLPAELALPRQLGAPHPRSRAGRPRAPRADRSSPTGRACGRGRAW